MDLLRTPLTLGATMVRRVGGAGIAALRAALDRVPAGEDRFAEQEQAAPSARVPTPPAPAFEPSPRRPPPPPAPAAPPPRPAAPPPPPAARPATAPVEPPLGGQQEAAGPSGAGEVLRDLPAEEAELVAEVGDPDDVGASVHVEGEPFPGYDALRAPEIIARLSEADASTRAMVRLYEQAHKQRKTILDATRR